MSTVPGRIGPDQVAKIAGERQGPCAVAVAQQAGSGVRAGRYVCRVRRRSPRRPRRPVIAGAPGFRRSSRHMGTTRIAGPGFLRNAHPRRHSDGRRGARSSCRPSSTHELCLVAAGPPSAFRVALAPCEQRRKPEGGAGGGAGRNWETAREAAGTRRRKEAWDGAGTGQGTGRDGAGDRQAGSRRARGPYSSSGVAASQSLPVPGS